MCQEMPFKSLNHQAGSNGHKPSKKIIRGGKDWCRSLEGERLMRLAYPQYAARLDNAKEPKTASQLVRRLGPVIPSNFCLTGASLLIRRRR